MHYVEVKGILSAQNGMNLYRGCTHGCIYCDSRSDCYQMEHDFEDIEVKINAVSLLDAALLRKRNKCMIGTGAMCDPYLHCEKDLLLTKRSLEVIYKHGFGVTLLTKSDLILRDIELLKKINESTKCVVQMTLTTFDEELCRLIEPNVCTTKRRAEVLKIMSENGIPTIVWLSPILPYINDSAENLCGILDICFSVGVKGIICFGMGTTMRNGSRDYFYKSLRKIDRFGEQMRKRYNFRYGENYICPSDNSGSLMEIFHSECEKHGVIHDNTQIFNYLRKFPAPQFEQLSLINDG